MPESWIEFLFRRKPLFIGSEKNFDEADYVAFGVPFDATSSHRPGSRFAPLELRLMSEYLELPEEHKISLCDLGDLHPTGSIEIMLRRVGEAVEKIAERGKVPVILGGEHTVSLASVFGLREVECLIVFDAHLDMRDEFMDTKLNHSTWLRRLLEKHKVNKTIIVGARAYVEEEREFAEKHQVEIISTMEIFFDFKTSARKLKALTSDASNVYLSIDLDVLDPAYASGVSNPEPGGIFPIHLYEMVKICSEAGLRGLDLVEVNPLFDNGLAAANAVYAAYHALLTSSTTSSEA